MLKVVYENLAVGVEGNVANTATEKQPFIDLDQINNKQNILNYGTLEGNNWLLTDDVKILPDDLEHTALGYWSEQLSNSDGTFDNDIKITRTYTGSFTSPGFTITFDTYNETYASEVIIKWYRGTSVLDTKTFNPTSSIYFVQIMLLHIIK